jgi:hypothetical protein
VIVILSVLCLRIVVVNVHIFFYRFIQDGGLTTGDGEILNYATKIYKNLFGDVLLIPVALLDELREC